MLDPDGVIWCRSNGMIHAMSQGYEYQTMCGKDAVWDSPGALSYKKLVGPVCDECTETIMRLLMQGRVRS